MSTSKKATIAFAVLVLVAVGVALLRQMWWGYSAAAGQACVNNLRQLEGAKQQWALENHKDEDTNAAPAWQDLQPYLNHKLTCPDGGTYVLGRVGEQPKCSLAGQRTNGRIHTQPKE